jgi:hypothetical protein
MAEMWYGFDDGFDSGSVLLKNVFDDEWQLDGGLY